MKTLSLPILFSLVAATAATADEGMWPFNLYPVEQIEKKHGVKVTPELLERAMKSSVRFNNGGSGSFVSKDGLVMTNHHVASDCIAKLTAEPGAPNYMEDGFVSKGRSDERQCPDLELNVLQKIEEVTSQVEAAAKDAPNDADKNKARKAEMSKIEKACADASGMRCDVVTLYGGGRYDLYTYKKYTDVRLVFAPEFQSAFFGGDPDNFTFPREDLDLALVRVYENDKPASLTHYLPFSTRGPHDGDTVFVSGHPGSTDRFTVLAKLELLRDVSYPTILDRYTAWQKILVDYMKRGSAEEKAAHDDFFSVENALKAIKGYNSGLNDKELMGDFKRRQDELLVKLNALQDKNERDRLLEAWPKLEKAYKGMRDYGKPLFVTERNLGPNGELFGIARTLVRLADEMPKKSEERLREYRDSNLPSVELHLFSTAHIEPSLEIEKIAFGLENMRTVLTAKDRDVKKALNGKEPRARAEEVVKGTKLLDVNVRKALYERIKKGEGKAALDEAKDPLIEFVRSYDARARDLRKTYEDNVESAERTYNGRIAEAINKVYGTGVYPDATFTLRIATGKVAGYTEDGGRKVSWNTGFGDLYRKSKRHKDQPPYNLPKRWQEQMNNVDFTVPFNFVSTNDIIGGNSGSPVWNKDGQVVGLIFDGNIQSLPNRFVYSETQARAVSVASNGILHALERVYGARHIVDELVPATTHGE
jgi:hypothetical protein